MHSVVRWDSLLSNTLVLWVVELLSGVFFFCGIPRVLEAVLGDSVCGCWFLGGGGAGEGRKGGARGGGRDRDRDRDRERRIIILKEEKETGGGSSGDRDRESVSSGLIAGKGGRWRQLGEALWRGLG